MGNVGCNGTERNLTECCGTEIHDDLYCLSRAYAGVRCMCICIQFKLYLLIKLLTMLQVLNVKRTVSNYLVNSLKMEDTFSFV